MGDDHGQRQPRHAQSRHQTLELSSHMMRDPTSCHRHADPVECLWKAVIFGMVGRPYLYRVAEVLQTDGRIHDEAFGAT